MAYLNYLGSLIINDARYTDDIKSSTAMARVAFKKKTRLFQTLIGLNLRKKLVKCYIWNRAIYIYGAETEGTSETGSEISGKF